MTHSLSAGGRPGRVGVSALYTQLTDDDVIALRRPCLRSAASGRLRSLTGRLLLSGRLFILNEPSAASCRKKVCV